MTRLSIRSDRHRRPANRRPGLILGRRFALTLVLTGGLLGYSGQVAQADSSGPTVSATVYSASGTSTESVSVDQLEASSQCPEYSGPNVMDEMGRQGPVDVTLSQTDTWALSTILGCLQPDPVPVSSVQGVTVMNADGTPQTDSGSQITPADLKPLGQTDFNNQDEGPVVTALGSSVRYDRPWRGSTQGQPDYDFSDEVTTDSSNGQAEPVDIEVFEGPLLTVNASASQTTVAVGETITFDATVTGQDGSALSYSWNFDGGALNSTAAAPQVTFGNTGAYDVTVQVTDSAGGGGGAEIPITVGTPPPAATGTHHQKGAGKSKKSHSPTGPQKSRGNHAGGRAGNSSPGTSTTTGSGSAANTGKSTSTTSTTTPTSTTPTSTTPDSTPGSSSKTSSAPHRTAISTSAARHATAPLARPSRPPASGPVVVGLLVSDVTPLAADVSPLVHIVPAAVATAPPARQAIRASVLTPIAAGVAVLVLLGLGAGRELQGRRGRRTRRAHS